jgi:ATP-dependent RNA helicase RhlE
MEERAYLHDIHKLIARNIPVVDAHPYHHNSTAAPLKQQPAKQAAGNKEQRPHRGPGNNNRPGNSARNNSNNRNRQRNRQSAPDRQR